MMQRIRVGSRETAPARGLYSKTDFRRVERGERSPHAYSELVFEEKRDSRMTYREKLRQANREAIAAVIGLAATIVVWAALGFGVAAMGIVVFSTPLWVITGCVGTFAFAVLVAVVMARFVMTDVGLDDDEEAADEG